MAYEQESSFFFTLHEIIDKEIKMWKLPSIGPKHIYISTNEQILWAFKTTKGTFVPKKKHFLYANMG